MNAGVFEQAVQELAQGIGTSATPEEAAQSSTLRRFAIALPSHVVDAHAEHRTGKQSGELTTEDRQQATADLFATMHSVFAPEEAVNDG